METTEKAEISLDSLNPKQEEIYRRLREIGDEIAAFYLDGIRILNDEQIQTKSNLLAHIAREIDGGLRDILASKEILDKNKTISKDEIKVLKAEINSELEAKGIDKIDNISNHVISVCNALSIDSNSNLLREWIICSSQFHKFAHRHGAYKSPRPLEMFQDIWSRYENILFKLIGSYYRFLDRIDDLLEKEEPSKDIINALPNLLQTGAREHYFFTKLNHQSWLKPLREAGFFDPTNNPEPILSSDGNGYSFPFWSELNYLERIVLASEEENIDLIIDIIKKIIDHREEKKDIIINSKTDYQVFKIICALPSEKIIEEHIGFIKDILISGIFNSPIASDINKILIPKLVADKNKEILLSLLEVVTEFNIDKKEFVCIVNSKIEDYWLEDLVSKNCEVITNILGIDIVRLLLGKIRDLCKVNEHSFIVETIEDSDQNILKHQYEAIIIRFLKESIFQLDSAKLRLFVEEWIDDDLAILKRMALFVINKRYTDYNDLFWCIENPIKNLACKHELYDLLSNHATEFNQEQINKVVEWIEEIKVEYLDESDKVYEARLKKEWYLTLLDSENENVLEKYKVYNELSPKTIEHPGFITYTEALWGEESPLQEVEMNQMTSKEISEYLESFEEQKNNFRAPTIMGLADTFKKIVIENPHRFSDELDVYKEVPMIYRYFLLQGFSQAWKDGKSFDWNNVLEYIQYTLKNDIKLIDNKEEFNYYEWFIGQACRLIKDGTKSDKHAFDEKFLPLAKEILLLMKTNVGSHEFTVDDYVTFVLNSTKGQLLEAMINYSLRVARVENKKEWDNDIKAVFCYELKDKQSLEVHTILGQYIGNCLYLDEEWIKDNILLIFPQEKPKHFLAALDGYFLSSTVYNNLYHLLKNVEIYSNILQKWDENSKRINDKIIIHICLAYAEGWESVEVDDSLISILLKKKQTHEMIIHFFENNSKNFKEKYKSKIKNLWQILFEINKDSNKKTIGKLTAWLVIFDELDDNLFHWLEEGAPYVGPYWDSYSFIENLTRFMNEEPRKCGELFWVLIKDREYLDDYEKENILFIISTLYQKEEKEIANKICNRYAENGIYFLREMYNENN
ncbi:hypothetical protein MettiDRAFT_1588 [Methanolobus tindarius DSM 2278]|uniref:Uncharacterized protein n=1 Tax=Methanolobus tindarius DSM 2278 TaxID=1090322 RepID=W9DRH9_METTI|nr:hypothetical protein [Methanolobus tindarius]ETA68135.1 hypothetical protein MettiDRAFT_1588 [Methanolobus tindarius DSM 2278]